MIYITAAVALLAIFDPAIGSGEPLWDYAGDILGPDSWATVFPTCDGTMQSPIDIETSLAISTRLTPFNLAQYSTASGSLTTVLNNEEGHTVKLAYSGPNITIQGGGLSDDYILDQLHFHWGSNDLVGSEHRVDGVVEPLEMHIVHHAKSFSAEVAATEPFGLAVLGFFFKLRQDDNTALEPLISHFDEVTFKDEEVTVIPAFNLTTLLPVNVGYRSFYRYCGSLTTPPCYQSVVWTVFKDKIPISKRQLDAFRTLKRTARGVTGQPLVDNFRPIQPLKDRPIIYNTAGY